MSSGNTGSSQMQKNIPVRKRKPLKSFIKIRENNRETLKTCGILLIEKLMLIVKQGSNNLMAHMDEILHSILFLGYIHESHLTPRDFFTSTVHKQVSDMFPEALKNYNSHLPTRTPFSILLDMMKKLYSTEDEIKKKLASLLKELKFPNPLHKPGSKNQEYYTLESTAICVCSDSDSEKYYGASLCCRKGPAKKILIDLSCLNTWHKYVSHAVMSFSSGDSDSGDGITFPNTLKCQAYYRDWKENVYKIKKPCSNCGQLFNLRDADPDKVEHPYGNCAETECLSKLLLNNRCMYENAMINNHTDQRIQELTNSTKNRLIEQLEKVGITITDSNLLFYNPPEERCWCIGPQFK